jgi:very-short-patch-repair endonuclease
MKSPIEKMFYEAFMEMAMDGQEYTIDIHLDAAGSHVLGGALSRDWAPDEHRYRYCRKGGSGAAELTRVYTQVHRQWVPDRHLVVLCQPKILHTRYIADFAVIANSGSGPALCVIECDGHDYHERTKEQARHDRKRDRELLMLGVTTVRFTGSEIFTDGANCALDALLIVDALADRDQELDYYRTKLDSIEGAS